jgi:asparagine synthase (glutamine-hydrolysing)
MCGVGVVLDPAAGTSDSAVAAMLAMLRHRGPDGEAARRIGPVMLLHTRLAIIDVAGGDQPLESEDGSCVCVVNGEIYNHLDLRRELRALGHVFATGSDCEVVVHGYEEWGPDCVRRLNGIFGFALWDDHRQRLLAARDPLGVKPLYWSARGRRVAIASEVGALMASGIAVREVDQVALDHFLAWRFVPAPRTLFMGVQKLAPASVLSAQDGRVSISRYLEPPGEVISDASVDELAEELVTGVEAAVRRQMMSEVPYGAFLSGGVDSTAIVAAMQRADAGRPRTFTIGFPGYGADLDERAAAERSARTLGSDHRDTAMEEFDFAAQLAHSVRRLEEPCGTASAPAALQLSEFAAQDVKVVLSGQGADEPLGGYQRHQAAAVVDLLDCAPRWLIRPAHALADAVPRHERVKRATSLLAAPQGLPRLLAIFEITTPELRAQLTGGPNPDARDERIRLAEEVLRDIGDRADPLEQAIYLDTHLFLPDSLLLYGDKMSMAASLEQRVPFLDLELLRFVERVPARFRVRHLRRKWLYRRAMEGLVPPAVLRRRKHPFTTPYDKWLRASLGARVDEAYGANPALAAVVDRDAVSQLVAAHRAGRADNKRVLYCLLELAFWHAAFIEGRSDPELRTVSA